MGPNSLSGCLAALSIWYLVYQVGCQDDYESHYQEFISTESERGLFPNIFNLATNSLINASSTCGQHKKEDYCKLVEHVLLKGLSNSPQCDICDANDVRYRHPIEFAIDGTRRWWQSPSLANGLIYEKVNITIDLRQEYQVAYVVVKMGNAPRPGSWVLEKSLDGINYSPWQYYATSDAECMRQFGVPATTGVPRYQADDEVHCTSEYSKLTPLEAGEIHTSLVNGRPGVEKPSAELQRFTRARYVRLRLISPKTLNADLMIINKQSHRIDKSVTMRYFYSISDISIGGQCICYGHAETCPSDPVTGQFKCECRHNTCGESCNRCCPLFNQLPWKQGTHAQPNVCQQCQCFNHADSCVYDEELDINKWSITPEGVYEGGGRCIDCKHNTEGFNCERCKDGYYRPSGTTHYSTDACRSCDCDQVGSVSDVCIRDDQSAINGQHPGDCVCKPGFGGRRCERCARGYRNYPSCEPCPCNQAGSKNFDTCEEATCQCKPNVEGIYCDRCKAGTIHLNPSNPDGCQPCFCFGLTSTCRQNEWSTASISNNLGWNLTDISGGKNVKPDSESKEILMFNANQNSDRSLYYWKAPEAFSGNMLNSYGGNLHYYVYYVPTEQGAAVPVADVIIEGNGIKLEYYSRIDFFPRENMTVLIPIREGSGWYNSASRKTVEKADMMRALAHVDKFLVRAMYQQNQLQSSIFRLTLDTAVPSSDPELDDRLDVLHPPPSDILMRGVEVCSCPDNTAGNSCESCAKGYRRVNNQLYGGSCEKCSCEGHSDTCDPYTGACINCQHNTTGTRCELCIRGHYGNPSLKGELGTCRPCECPMLENNQSPDCMLTQLIVAGSAASNLDDYVCTNCNKGYEGNKCEICEDGYFGDPWENIPCVECNCNGNIDPMDIGNCDKTTGKCLKCIGDTTGEHCEKCKDNHWGSALDKSCRSCGCHSVGSESSQCNISNGDCSCKENYIGKQCDRCKDGHGDVDDGCPACECSTTGSIGTECDQVSGQCTCKQGVFGKRCDQCRPSYFNFSDSGCQFCHCNIYGSVEDGNCNNVTGKCECRDNVDGKMCEKCVDGYFNITSGNGCESCDCDEMGSEGVSCDLHTGQCVCKPGVSGTKCDTCMPNHYGMSKGGCKECQTCPAPGQVCDSRTGECVCPPNTIGEMCESCRPNTWNYHPLKGCTLCDCSNIGSNSGECDSKTGQCVCKSAYVGLKCDRCSHGFFRFPDCLPCGCSVGGTEPSQCKGDNCLCDESGQCPCKKNAFGEKCDQCKEGTFSLDETSVLGCTNCFCFGRSDKCSQSDVIWQQVYAEDRYVKFAEPWQYYTKKHTLNILNEYPARYNSYPTDVVPLYWPLPKSFLGDRTSSYNGFIRFKIWNEDNRRGIHGILPEYSNFHIFPQIVLVGNNRIELEYTPTEIKEDGKYKVRLHESWWKSRQSPEVAVTRKQLMLALQNLQGIYIRGTYNYPARGDAISINEISLDVAVAHNETSIGGSIALGVELCTACPQGYTGSSCQNPAEGYCRKKQRDYLNTLDDMALIGWSEPCGCNGHSTTCHPETCVCKDCQHNTYGDMCELCLVGYIGDAREGGSSACTKCACPLIDNSFSDTCVAVNYGRGYVCNGCKPGYTGQYCESCVGGFFGDPGHVGGFCAPCDCHPDGSLHGSCHSLTGQCECRDGVTGRDCSRCQQRHAFIHGVCTSCDTGCHLPLMQMVDELEETMAGQNFTNLRPIPWKRIYRIGNKTEVIFSFVSTIGSNQKEGEVGGINSKYAKDAFSVIEEARFQRDRMEKSENSLKDFTKMAEELTLSAQKSYGIAFNTTQFLKHFHMYGGSSVGGATLDSWSMEAEAHYNASLDRGDYIERRLNRAEGEHRRSEALFKKVFSNKLNDTNFENLKTRLDDFETWMDAYRTTIYEGPKQDISNADKMSNLVEKRIDRYKEVSNDIEKKRIEADDELGIARDKVEQAKKTELLDLFDHIQFINDTLESASIQADECANITLQYAQLIDDYDERYVKEAEKYARKLEIESAKLKDSFKGIKAEAEMPLKASQAYNDIVGALKNASTAAKAAKKAANVAYSATVDPDAESTMVKDVQDSNQRSSTLAADAATLRKQWEEENLDKERTGYDDRLAYVNEQNIDMTKRNDRVRDQWSKFDDYHDRMAGLQSTARQANERSNAAKKEAEMGKEEIDGLEIETSRLVNSTGQGIREETEKIRETRMQLQKLTDSLKKVGGSSNSNKNKSDEMQKQLALLKEKINEVREKAQQIRLSLSSDERGQCRRTFVSPAHPSPTSIFSIKYRPLRNVPDSVILLTKTQTRRTLASEYIAVEVREKRVVVHWNIGSGKRKVTNSLPINFIPLSDKGTWYHIDIERTANAVNLTVALRERIIGEGDRLRSEPITVVVGKSESDNDVIFNTVPGETLLAMGTDTETAKEVGLGQHKFHGIIGGLTVDEVNVPLWSFASTTDECEGANAPRKLVVRGYMFRDGFAQIPLSVLERTISSITVTFNAYSSNGLLYFRGSEESGDFVAIMLKDGHVVFKINIGGKSSATVESKGSYADGRQHTVKAIRNEAGLHLQVDSDADRLSTILPGENNILNINHDHHFVAGVPSSFKMEKFAEHMITWKGFFGCILTVKPDQIAELNMDTASRWQRRDAGCSFSSNRLLPNDRLVSFSRPGYLLTEGVIIDNNATFGFGFRTKEENGTLIFQSSKLSSFIRRQRDSEGIPNGKGYMVFYLFRGFLVLHFGKESTSRKDVVTLRSTQQLNDGQLHSVFMSRDGKIIRLRIDDKDLGETGRLEDESSVGTATSQMYLGGFPERSKPSTSEIPHTIPFIGCISDLFHNFKRVPLIPDDHSANIGSCAIDSPNFSVPIDDPLDIEGTKGHRKNSKMSHQLDPYFYDVEKKTNEETKREEAKRCGGGFSNAVKDGSGSCRFGISKTSHSRINFANNYPNITDFKLSLTLRTDKPDGMVWVWANYKNYTRYFYLNIIDGFATLEVKGHRQPKILKATERKLDDGQWHDILIVKKERELSMQVDDLSPVSIGDCPAPKVMRRRMYIGGVISRHRSTFALDTPGFNGCIRDLRINDIVKEMESESRDVIPCARSSLAMYAHDGGFAVFDGLHKSMKPGTKNLSISMEFRPLVDEGTVFALLTNSNPEKTRLTIEIKQDKMLVTLVDEASGVEIRDAIPSLRPFCDGKWHTVSLSIQGNIMLLVLDGEKNEVSVELLPQSTRQLLLNLPVNIGGVSAPVAETLSMSSLVGCYRDLRLSDQPKYFEKAMKSNKIAINACPFE